METRLGFEDILSSNQPVREAYELLIAKRVARLPEEGTTVEFVLEFKKQKLESPEEDM